MNIYPHRATRLSINAILLLLLIALSPARAAFWIDPVPPIGWEALRSCKLVVVARYHSHQENELTLQVVEAWRGSARPGQSIRVALEHLYTIETGPVGWDRGLRRKATPDGIPKLCYKRQLVNPGEPVPVALLSDARQQAIYFFPEESRPALKQREQVQPLLFQRGWQQALADRPIDITFRLAQMVSPEVARDALEELGRNRQGAALEQLFDWVLNPVLQDNFHWYCPESQLALLGDRHGDVYDRAARLIRENRPGANAYRFGTLAMVMAAVDPERAQQDLPKLLSNDNPLLVRQGALAGLGRIRQRAAVELAVDQLRDPELAEAAMWSIRSQLDSENYRLPKIPVFEDGEWVLEQLRAAQQDAAVPEPIRKRIGDQFGLRSRKTPLDLEDLRRRLLDPTDRSYYWADGETVELLRQAREACDSRVAPLLVEVLHKVPAARERGASELQDTIVFYARICPRAMRRELESRQLTELVEGLMGLAKPQEHPDRQAAIARCLGLSKQVRRGESDQVEALLRAADELIEKWSAPDVGVKALLESDSTAARDHYLMLIQRARRPTVHRLSGELTIESNLLSLLNPLFPDHTALYCQQVCSLLRSKSLAERKAGVTSLRWTLNTDFDFNPEALQAARATALERIEPVLERLVGKTQRQVRIILLAHEGLLLEGEPGVGWLVALQRATGKNDENIASNALRLIELIVDDARLQRLEYLPPKHRKAAVTAYLQDAKVMIRVQ